MADNTILNSGSGGDTIATDDIAGVKHQLVKIEFGAADSATQVSATAALPTQLTDNTDTALISAGGALQVEVASALPTGTNSIGRLGANSGVDIGDVDVTSIIPGTSATNLGKAIDAIGGATDTGVPPLAVRDDALGVLTPIEGDYVALRVDANGALWVHDDALDAALGGAELQVDIVAALPTGANNIGDVDVLTVPAPLSTTGGGVEATALRVTVASDSTGVLSVDDNAGNLSIDFAGTAPTLNTGIVTAGTLRVTLATDVALPAGTANIGDVDVLTLPASTNTIEVVGDVAHDAVAAGNPVLIAASHETIADTAPTNRLATITDGDATRLSAMDGALFVIPSGPQQWKARLTGLIAADTTVKAAPAAGLSLYIQTVVFSIGAATASSILLEESTTTAVFGPHYLEAINGRGLAVQFNPPIKIAAATLLSATGTGATTATLDVYGFTGPG